MVHSAAKGIPHQPWVGCHREVVSETLQVIPVDRAATINQQLLH